MLSNRAATTSDLPELIETSLTVPAGPESLRAVRLLAAEAAARAGFDVDEVQDVRIGIDELAHAAVRECDGTLRIDLRVGPGLLEIEGAAGQLPAGSVPWLSDLAALVLPAVADDWALHVDGRQVCFTLRRQSPGADRGASLT